MLISDFITRCDRYCAARAVSRTWLSKRLFADTYKLAQLDAAAKAEPSAQKVDIGVFRLERAIKDLAALEAEAMAGTAVSAA